MSEVQLTISKEIVTPIVEAKVKEAILAALGGSENVVKNVIEQIITKKVSASGNVSSYSHDNKHTWLDVVITQQIQKVAEEAIKEELSKSALIIKDALIKSLQTKKGASVVANALLDSMNGSFQKAWTSSVKIDFQRISND